MPKYKEKMRLLSSISRSIAVSAADVPALHHHLAQLLALILAQFLPGETRQHNAIGPILLKHILPLVGGQRHFPLDALAQVGVFEALDHLVETAIMRPSGNAGCETSAAVGIGVHIGGERQSFGAGRFYFRNDLAHLVPIH